MKNTTILTLYSDDRFSNCVLFKEHPRKNESYKKFLVDSTILFDTGPSQTFPNLLKLITVYSDLYKILIEWNIDPLVIHGTQQENSESYHTMTDHITITPVLISENQLECLEEKVRNSNNHVNIIAEKLDFSDDSITFDESFVLYVYVSDGIGEKDSHWVQSKHRIVAFAVTNEFSDDLKYFRKINHKLFPVIDIIQTEITLTEDVNDFFLTIAVNILLKETGESLSFELKKCESIWFKNSLKHEIIETFTNEKLECEKVYVIESQIAHEKLMTMKKGISTETFKFKVKNDKKR